MSGAGIENRSELNLILQRLDQLTELVRGQVAKGQGNGQAHQDSAFRFADGAEEPGSSTRSGRPALPPPELIRRIIKLRKARSRHISSSLFADPAWDMLLDLTAARAEHKRVSISSLCIASGVPSTTALRWIAQMVDEGVLVRSRDDLDARRAFISISDETAWAMAEYFHEVIEGGIIVI